jgi:hypothetical protein
VAAGRLLLSQTPDLVSSQTCLPHQSCGFGHPFPSGRRGISAPLVSARSTHATTSTFFAFACLQLQLLEITPVSFPTSHLLDLFISPDALARPPAMYHACTASRPSTESPVVSGVFSLPSHRPRLPSFHELTERLTDEEDGLNSPVQLPLPRLSTTPPSQMRNPFSLTQYGTPSRLASFMEGDTKADHAQQPTAVAAAPPDTPYDCCNHPAGSQLPTHRRQSGLPSLTTDISMKSQVNINYDHGLQLHDDETLVPHSYRDALKGVSASVSQTGSPSCPTLPRTHYPIPLINNKLTTQDLNRLLKPLRLRRALQRPMPGRTRRSTRQNHNRRLPTFIENGAYDDHECKRCEEKVEGGSSPGGMRRVGR